MAALSPGLRATRRTRRHFQWRLGQAARVSAAWAWLCPSNPLGPLSKRGWCMARLAALARHAPCACTMQLRRLVFRASQRVARDARRASSWLNASVRHTAFPAALLARLCLACPRCRAGLGRMTWGIFSFLGRGTSWRALGTRSERARFARAETLGCCAWVAGGVPSSHGRRSGVRWLHSLPSQTMHLGTTLLVASGACPLLRPKRSGRR